MDEVDNAPTLERRRHGLIEHGVETVAYDNDDRPVRALADRAVGTIERMVKRGAIDDTMADAAERFRGDFYVSALEGLRAASMRERTSSAPTDLHISWHAARARDRVFSALTAVGQPGASCLWAVIGEDRSLKEWSRTIRVYSDENATGVLISALGALRAHYKL